jgi:Grx4 family monothiol glutaredoxin
MSTLKTISSQSAFDEHISTLPQNTLLILSFHAPWAAPCAQMRTILTTLASTYPVTSPPTISFIEIDAEELPDISESYDVTAVPFLVLQRGGEKLESISGCDATKVREVIERWYNSKGNTNGTSKTVLPAKLDVTKRAEDENAGTTTTTTDSNTPAPAKNLSNYAPTSSDPQTAPSMSGSADISSSAQAPPPAQAPSQDELNARLENLVKAAPVMLFMKGTPSSPQCGFSRQLVGILRERGVRYGFFNILADEDVRQGLKVFADWPTYPQLWVGGELVGGLDIVSPSPFFSPLFLSLFLPCSCFIPLSLFSLYILFYYIKICLYI